MYDAWTRSCTRMRDSAPFVSQFYPVFQFLQMLSSLCGKYISCSRKYHHPASIQRQTNRYTTNGLQWFFKGTVLLGCKMNPIPKPFRHYSNQCISYMTIDTQNGMNSDHLPAGCWVLNVFIPSRIKRPLLASTKPGCVV